LKNTRILSLTIFILLILVAVSAAQQNVQPLSQGEEATSISQLVGGNNQFAVEFYLKASENAGNDNIFFSPFSISAALGMTYAGAEGETADEMAHVLHFVLPMETTCRAFGSLMERLSSGDVQDAQSGEPFTLAITNGLWVQDGFSLLSDFVARAESNFDAAVRNLDFRGDLEGSRTTINDWVAEKTAERILNLLPQGVINPDTRVVLTNAVYFKANWQSPFEESLTRDGSFSLEDRSSVTVPMMQQTEFFKYVSAEGCSAIEMDYFGGTASMLILLPDGSLEDFEENLDADFINNIRVRMTSQNVALSMPRFEFTRSMSLNQMLIDMGMPTPFSTEADFSGFTGAPDLFISAVVHKAFVKVDESGTEAAAATAVVMAIQCIPPTPVEMNIDHPFLFLIMDKQTGSILFMGRVMDPSS
jgi:serpin B